MSWTTFYQASETVVYLVHSRLGAFHVDKIGELWSKFSVLQTTFHPLLSEEDFKQCLGQQFPQLAPSLALPEKIISLTRFNPCPDVRGVSVMFMSSRCFLTGPGLKKFNGMMRVGRWGGNEDEETRVQLVLVFAGTGSLLFHICCPGDVDPAKYKSNINLFNSLQPRDLSLGLRGKGVLKGSLFSTNSCPCETGTDLYRPQHPKRVCMPVGVQQSTKDVARMLRVLGLYGACDRDLLDLCSFLSIVSFDIER